ncbi:MAG: ribosome silencing factor [Pseudomonadota bacterium]
MTASPAPTLNRVVDALDDLKGSDIKTLDVTGMSDVTDWMVLASGTSNRHVRALVDNVVEELKADGLRPLGVEGKESCEWVLVDFGDVVVHVMRAETREFYDLERLWSELPAEDSGGDLSSDGDGAQ